jgi:VWFA-related protein
MTLPFFSTKVRVSKTLLLCLAGTGFGLPHGGRCQTDGQSAFSDSAIPAYQQTNPHREGLIHLDVSVMDGAGDEVSGLSADKFRLTDNGSPGELLSFHESGQTVDENEKLTEMVLVLDRLNLTPDQFESARKEVIRFLRENGGKLNEPVSVYWLTRDGLRASMMPTINGEELAAEVSRNYAPRVLWQVHPDATPDMTAASDRYVLWEQSLRVLYTAALERRDKPGRKALVWIGYGWPAIMDRDTAKNLEFYRLVEVTTRLREARLAVFQIPIWRDPQIQQFQYLNYVEGVHSPTELEKPAPHFALPVLAYQSGGMVLEEKGDVAIDIERCARVAGAFYTVSFDPPPATHLDEFHEIHIGVEVPGLKAQAITGYYDQPAFYDQPQAFEEAVTVEQLAKLLQSNERERDEDLASRLAGLKLTERLSSDRLSSLRDRIPGKKAKAALTAIADQSVFLSVPAAEIVNEPAPERAAQVQILSQTVKYVNSLIPKLPDFFATRTTIVYQQQSSEGENFWKTATPDQSLKMAGKDLATLLYRQGHEQQEQRRKRYKRAGQDKYLYFRGVFGPILGFVLRDATRNGSTLTWSRWQRGSSGTLAVFRYAVHGSSPDYAVEMCCVFGGAVFRTAPEYHGELTIDPETGTILRLTMESEPGWIQEPNLQGVRPVLETGSMIEYGPVEIGGRKFICPLRSVVIMRSRTARGLSVLDEPFEVYTPYETLLNDLSYTEYHKFGSESRILPD